MSPEEFQRIKEAEKAHLRKLKQLKDAVRVLERQKKISGAVTDMTSSMEQTMDEHREAMERVAIDAARSEARLEMALEAADEEEVVRRSHEAEDEEALREHRAKELIRQIKAGETADEPRTRTETGASRARTRTETDASHAGQRPAAAEPQSRKRAGSASQSEAKDTPDAGTDEPSDSAPIPEKTIGRMKP